MGAWWIIIFLAAGFLVFYLSHWYWRIQYKIIAWRLRRLSKKIDDDEDVKKAVNDAADALDEESKKGFFDKDEEDSNNNYY